MPFAALVTAGLLLVARIHDGDARARETWLAGALLGAALLTRSAGLACAAGAVLGLLLQRRWRAAAECAAGVVAAAGAWAWWVSQHAASAVGYVYYSAANYGAWNIVTNYAWAEKLRVLRLNALFFGLAPALFWDIKTSSFWAPIVSVLFFLILGRGVWNAWRHPVAMVMVTYLATVMCWAWPPFRFLAPMAPGFAWLVVAGAPKAPNALRALACVIVAALGFQLWNQNLERVEKLTIWPNAGYADSWRLTAPLLEWVMRSTPPNAVLTGNLDPEYFLYTGRKAVRPFSVDAYALYYAPPGGNPVGTVEEFRERLRAIGASYLIVTPGVGFGESAPLNRLVTELVAAHPDNLSVVAGSSTSGYVVYEIHRDKLRADRAAVSD
jgi:hypothetical protein